MIHIIGIFRVVEGLIYFDGDFNMRNGLSRPLPSSINICAMYIYNIATLYRLTRANSILSSAYFHYLSFFPPFFSIKVRVCLIFN